MSTEADATYVLRIWWEADGEAGRAWRARATNATTREERCFAAPDALARFLGLEDPDPEELPPTPIPRPTAEGGPLLADGAGATSDGSSVLG